MLKKFNEQHLAAQSIVTKREMGVLLLDVTKLKKKIVPNPLRCLKVCLVY